MPSIELFKQQSQDYIDSVPWMAIIAALLRGSVHRRCSAIFRLIIVAATRFI